MQEPLINITKRQAYFYAAFLVMYEFLTYIANDMIMPGMINVVKTFNGPESAVANSLTVYVLGGASLQLILGPLSDRFGRRPVMIFGVLLFFLCTLFISVSNSMNQFLIARFFQGMGLCFIGVVGYATLQEIFAEMDAIRLISIMATVSILAPLIGPLLGAVFIHFYSWRMIFIVIAVLTVVVFFGILRYMPEPVGQVRRDGEEIKRQSLKFRSIVKNYSQLIKNRIFVLGSVSFGVLVVPCLAWIGLAPVILIADAKLTILQYALWQIPVFGASILGNWVLRRLTHRMSLNQILKYGSAVCVFGLFLIPTLTWMEGGGYAWIFPGVIIYFFGLGITVSPWNRLILFATPVAKGTASALMTLLEAIIQALGIEFANHFVVHNNRYFGVFCASTAILYIALACISKAMTVQVSE